MAKYQVFIGGRNDQRSQSHSSGFLDRAFGILTLSKRLDMLAEAAIVEAMRLDNQEALQPENESQEKEKEGAGNR
jgi:hypothetical protein